MTFNTVSLLIRTVIVVMRILVSLVQVPRAALVTALSDFADEVRLLSFFIVGNLSSFVCFLQRFRLFQYLIFKYFPSVLHS